MPATAVWLRRDLRLYDNPAIRHAADEAGQAVLLCIHAPREEHHLDPEGLNKIRCRCWRKLLERLVTDSSWSHFLSMAAFPVLFVFGVVAVEPMHF